jgi:predicted helicase
MSCEDYERAMTILTRIIEAKKKDMDLNDIDLSDLASPDDTPDWEKFDPDDYDLNDVIDNAERLEGYSMEEILKIMQTFWKERDKKSSWIQFCSF